MDIDTLGSISSLRVFYLKRSTDDQRRAVRTGSLLRVLRRVLGGDAGAASWQQLGRRMDSTGKNQYEAPKTSKGDSFGCNLAAMTCDQVKEPT
eukprot:Skav203655  [mRNA]  locus=scaffold2755:43038:45422:- [translate_table: standard]